MNDEPENAFIRRARERFVDSVANLDARSMARLREARIRVVAEAGRRRLGWYARPWALPAGAASILIVAVAVGVLWWNVNPQPTVPLTANNSEDMAIMMSNDNLDMYADMDFYSWLQAQQQNSDPNNSAGNNNG
ncbi:MAG: hypothetical protein ACRETA_01390 [Gammaproteobacteria bacterium]